MDYRYNNYWFSTYTPEISQSLDLPKEVDIAIVGGGFAAISLLFQLLRNKVQDVVLLEANTLGFKNTGRSTGQITLTGGQKYFSQYKDKKFAKEYLQLTLQSIRQLNRSLESLDCDFEQSGGMHLASSEDELQFFKEEIEFLNQNGVEAVLLTEGDIKNLIGSDAFAGGIFIPCESTVNPYKLFFEAQKQLNGFANKIFQNARVEYVDGEDLLVSERGVIKAKRIVYCSGLGLIPKLKAQTQTIFHQSITTVKGDAPYINATYNYNSAKLRTHDGRFILENISKCRKMIDNNLLQKQIAELDIEIANVCSYNEVIGKDGVPLIGRIEDSEQYVMIGHDLSHSSLSAALMLTILKGGKTFKEFDPMREI